MPLCDGPFSIKNIKKSIVYGTFVWVKHRHAVHNCALASGLISTGREMLSGPQRSWTRGLSNSDNNRLAPKRADHRTEKATETWIKTQV